MTQLVTIEFFGNRYNLNIIPTNDIITEISNFIIYSNSNKDKYPFNVNHITQFTLNTNMDNKIINIVITPPEETIDYPFIMIDYSKYDDDTCFWIEINQKKIVFFFKYKKSIYYKLHTHKNNICEIKFSDTAKRRLEFIQGKYLK